MSFIGLGESFLKEVSLKLTVECLYPVTFTLIVEPVERAGWIFLFSGTENGQISCSAEMNAQ